MSLARFIITRRRRRHAAKACKYVLVRPREPASVFSRSYDASHKDPNRAHLTSQQENTDEKFPLVLTLCDPISKRILLYISYMLPKFSPRQYILKDLSLKIKSLRRCDRKGLNVRMYGRTWDSAIESTKRRSRISRSRIVVMNKYKECEYPSGNSAQFNPPILAAISLCHHYLE